MKLDKKIIRENFAKAAATYDESSNLQKEVAKGLVSRLLGLLENEYAPSGARLDAAVNGGAVTARLVLDIGCGTGSLISLMKAVIPDSVFCGCDIAHPMLLKAREECGGIPAVAAECERLPFADSSFDMAVSNLTYQWAADAASAFKEAARVLRPGGVFAFSTLGPDTLCELRGCYRDAVENILHEKTPLKPVFEDMDGIKTSLNSTGLDVIMLENRPVKKSYKDVFALLKTLKSIGASYVGEKGPKGLARGAVLRKASREYCERFPSPDGGIAATYDAIFMIARKI